MTDTFADACDALRQQAVDMTAGTLRNEGYIVIDPDFLPQVTVDGNGKPKLPSDDKTWQDLQVMTKGSRLRLEAYGKLALAAWYDARDAERTALRKELEQSLAQFGVHFSDRLADELIADGWHK